MKLTLEFISSGAINALKDRKDPSNLKYFKIEQRLEIGILILSGIYILNFEIKIIAPSSISEPNIRISLILG